MSPGVHLVTSWLIGNTALKERRNRIVVAIAGCSPDLDGLGLILDRIGYTSSLYFNYHHVLCHGIFWALLASIFSSLVVKTQRLVTAAMAFIVIHFHILADIAGSKGPDGYQWPINYLYPFSNNLMLEWSGQWELNAWPNFAFTGILLLACYIQAKKQGYSAFEIVPGSFDKEVFKLARKYIKKG
ncbi:MAG: metal-dependent hydrolase [Gammaproteobacteria bacterium]|nr:MAG: metal-dependent hydrolase [Gammaproteobacteria bacterium]